MNPKSAIKKGKELEDFIVERLRVTGIDTRAARTPGSGNGLIKADIWNDLNLYIECRNRKNFSPAWINEVEQCAKSLTPLLIWHPPRVPMESCVAIIPWWHYEDLLKRHKEPVVKEPDRAFRWKLEQLKKAVSEVLKELP